MKSCKTALIRERDDALVLIQNSAMIISRKHRFIFFAVPKTGTHSVRRALRVHLAEDDLEQVGLFVQKRFPFAEFADIQHGHISVREIQPVLGDAWFENSFKFAFVRNPFSRFVSYCAFISRDTTHFKDTPLAFMKYVIRDWRPFDQILFRPQHEFLVDAAGRIKMDFIGRVERMQSDYDAICERLTLPKSPLEQANASVHGDYREYFDAELIQLVAHFYRADLELFDYRFGE
jgi:hypothetical protein